MQIAAYSHYREDEILSLYLDAGWTAYTRDKAALKKGFEHSLKVLAAYEDGKLIGLLRAVGDGFTVVWVQDLLVLSAFRRRGVGRALLQAITQKYAHVRQIMLASDSTGENAAFYNACGFQPFSEMGMQGFMNVRNMENASMGKSK